MTTNDAESAAAVFLCRVPLRGAKACDELLSSLLWRQGVMHADPHGGNMLLTPDQRICYLASDESRADPTSPAAVAPQSLR